MADLAVRLKEEIKSMQQRAAVVRAKSKQEGQEILTDLAVSALAGIVGGLEGADKLAETYEVMGYNVPTKLAAGLIGKAVALGSKGKVRKAANEGARMMLGIAAYTSSKAAAEEAAAKK